MVALLVALQLAGTVSYGSTVFSSIEKIFESGDDARYYLIIAALTFVMFFVTMWRLTSRPHTGPFSKAYVRAVAPAALVITALFLLLWIQPLMDPKTYSGEGAFALFLGTILLAIPLVALFVGSAITATVMDRVPFLRVCMLLAALILLIGSAIALEPILLAPSCDTLDGHCWGQKALRKNSLSVCQQKDFSVQAECVGVFAAGKKDPTVCTTQLPSLYSFAPDECKYHYVIRAGKPADCALV